MLLSTRASLIRIEAGAAATAACKRLVIFASLAFCAFFCWALLLAGGIPALAKITGCAWHWLALAAAALHLSAALVLTWISRRPAPSSFQATKAEFQKDREWILKI